MRMSQPPPSQLHALLQVRAPLRGVAKRSSTQVRVIQSLLLLVFLTVILRVPGLDRPLVGNFATKNAVYAMIARNWASGRAAIAYPTLDSAASPATKAVDQPPVRSLHMLEFPASAYLTGSLWSWFGGSLDGWGRATSIGFSAAGVALLYLLVLGWHGQPVAFAAAVALAISPVSIIYGQSFMLEASLTCFLVAALLGYQRWLRGEHWLWLVLGAVSLLLLLLTKIYMVVLLLPIALFPPTRGRAGCAILATSLAVLPALAWCVHVFIVSSAEHPLAERIFYSFRNSAIVHHWPHPLLSAPDFYGHVLIDLGTVVLTPVGLALLVAGLFHPAWRQHRAWLFACGALIAALPLKFFEMNYYYLAILPALCVLIGLGWERISVLWQPPHWAVAGFVSAAILLSLRYSVRPAFMTPDEDRSVVAAADAAQRFLGGDEPVVTMHGSTIDLLYYTNRVGWAISPGNNSARLAARLEACRQQGARLLIVAGQEQFARCQEAKSLIDQLPVLESGDGYAIHYLPPPMYSAMFEHQKAR